MSANKSQTGTTPSEPLITNNENGSNIDQLLCMEIRTANQPFVQLTTTNIISSQTSLIPSHPQYDNVIRPQHARRGRARRHQANSRRQIEGRPQRYHERFHYYDSFVDRTDPMAYRLHLQDKENEYAREQYEQQQVNELEEFAAQEQLALIHDETEQMNQIETYEKMEEEKQIQQQQWEQEQLNELQGLTVSGELAVIEEENEQLNQIEVVKNIQQEEQQEKNNEDLIQLEQWEHVTFLIQQLNQN